MTRHVRVVHGPLIRFGAPKTELRKYALSRIGEGNLSGGLIGGFLRFLNYLQAAHRPPPGVLLANQ